jgi:hypothetical protein
MNQFTKQDNQIRQRFANEFKKGILKVELPPAYASHDIDFTGKTSLTVYKVELKQRDYLIEDLIGGLYFEQSKYNHFKILNRLEPNAELLYFNYFKDGWYSLNISNRFRQKSPDLDLVSTLVPLTTLGSRELIQKQVCKLKYQPALGDTIKYYDNEK